MQIIISLSLYYLFSARHRDQLFECKVTLGLQRNKPWQDLFDYSSARYRGHLRK